MVTWNNLDKLASFEELKKVERVNLAEVMSGENGAERVNLTAFRWQKDLRITTQQTGE